MHRQEPRRARLGYVKNYIIWRIRPWAAVDDDAVRRCLDLTVLSSQRFWSVAS